MHSHLPYLLSLLVLLKATVGKKHISYALQRRPIVGLNAARKWRGSLSFDESGRRLYKDLAKVHKESDGVYFTTICIGTEDSQCFTVIVDTGSSTIAVPCKGCSCGSQHNYFDKTLSKTVVDSGRSYGREDDGSLAKLTESIQNVEKEEINDDGVAQHMGDSYPSIWAGDTVKQEEMDKKEVDDEKKEQERQFSIKNIVEWYQ